ncbi:hypothetical protein C4572_03630 [Candidatus Parcubacteria bacterium]|nr:MAG: hypothetical protein C4572_03630 [Candidatus Parcubacteria bacterium]
MRNNINGIIKRAGKVLGFLLVFLPFVSFAEKKDFLKVNYGKGAKYIYGSGSGGSGGGSGTFWNLFYIIEDIMDRIVIFLIALAVIFFLYGVLKYIKSGGDEDERKKGGQLVLYGIIGLFVMVSFWGFVNILVYTFELDGSSQQIDIPRFKGGDGGTREGTGG